jgi:hypothetical protein
MDPDKDPHKRSIEVADIIDLEESPVRMPVLLADKLYAAGESGMGYTIFTLEFRDGSTLPVVAGNAIDFPPMPPGLRIEDIAEVHPHKGRDRGPRRAPEYHWAVFDGFASPA